MTSDNIADANEFCKKAGKKIQVLSTKDSPATVGNVARSEVQFMCLNENDPRLKGGVLVPVNPAPADKVIEKQ